MNGRVKVALGVLGIICGIIGCSLAGRDKEQGNTIHKVTTSTVGKSCELPEDAFSNKHPDGGHYNAYLGSCTKDNNEMCGLVPAASNSKDNKGESDTGSDRRRSGKLKYAGSDRRRSGKVKYASLLAAEDPTPTPDPPDSNEEPETEKPETKPPSPAMFPGICKCGYLNERDDGLIILLAPDNTGICRGPDGFPCKKYFLGEDKEGREGFNESCVTRKCDMELGMCVKEFQSKETNVACKRVAELSLIVAAGLGLLVRFFGLNYCRKLCLLC